jgi:hypothetical protein
MRVVENTDVRLFLKGGSPLFRPFFAGGVGLLLLGIGLILGGAVAGRATVGTPADGGEAFPIAGVGVFLVTFGFFLAVVPLAGKFPYRKEIIVDRSAGQFIRRDRTLLRLRQENYPIEDIQGIEVEPSRHVDGDPYFTLLLNLVSGESITLDRFTDGAAAGAIARVLRDHVGPEGVREIDRAGALSG